jgi:prepilin-type processing-associated H-X9-DG protein
MLAALGQSDFDDLVDPARPPPPPQPGAPGPPRWISGFLCPADPRTRTTTFTAPASYRAVTGADPAGSDGPFAPGQAITLAQIEAGNGTAHTAAFIERLLGSGSSPAQPDPANFALLPGPVAHDTLRQPFPAAAWRGDAGSAWNLSGWATTLATFDAPPNAPVSAIARDQATATLGASSAHAGRVHVLRCDGSVVPIAPSIDRAVWHALARVQAPPEPPSNALSPPRTPRPQ